MVDIDDVLIMPVPSGAIAAAPHAGDQTQWYPMGNGRQEFIDGWTWPVLTEGFRRG